MTQPQRVDPFAGGTSTPSVSFNGAAPGTAYTLEVLEYPDLVQSRDFETGQAAVWPDGNPKMSAVVKGRVLSGPQGIGEERSVWASKPSALFAAIQAAQNVAGAQIAPGGHLTIEYTHDEPNKTNPRLNPAKQYRASYTAPNAFAEPAPAAQATQQAVDAAMQAPGVPVTVAKQKVNATQFAALVNAGVDVSNYEIVA